MRGQDADATQADRAMPSPTQLSKVTCAALLVSLALAGCAALAAPSDVQERVSAYVASAQGQVEQCLARKAPCETSTAGANKLFDDAEDAVRLERGTSMYLERYHQRWTALMREVQQQEAAPSPQEERRLETESLALSALARKIQPRAMSRANVVSCAFER